MAVLKSNLGAIRLDVYEASHEALKQASEDIVSITKQLVPVDTGDLKNSYMYEFQTEDSVIIGSNQSRGVYKRGYPTYYAPYVEFGTEDHVEQPHFIHAWEQARNILRIRFAEQMAKKK